VTWAAWTAAELRRGLEIAADTALSWRKVGAVMASEGYALRGPQAVRKTLVRAGAPVRADVRRKQAPGLVAFTVSRPSRVIVELIAGGIRVDIRPIRGE
jgi:hypothetical protein